MTRSDTYTSDHWYHGDWRCCCRVTGAQGACLPEQEETRASCRAVFNAYQTTVSSMSKQCILSIYLSTATMTEHYDIYLILSSDGMYL